MGRLMDAVLAVSMLAMASACGLGRLGDQLLQGQFRVHVLYGQISKTGGGYKNGCILENVSPIELKPGKNAPKGVLHL